MLLVEDIIHSHEMHISSIERIVCRTKAVDIILAAGIVIHTVLIVIVITDRVEERKIAVTIIDCNIRHYILHIVPLVEIIINEVAEYKRIYILVLTAFNTCIYGSLHIRNTFCAESLDMSVILALRVTYDDERQFILNAVHRCESEVVAVQRIRIEPAMLIEERLFCLLIKIHLILRRSGIINYSCKRISNKLIDTVPVGRCD